MVSSLGGSVFRGEIDDFWPIGAHVLGRSEMLCLIPMKKRQQRRDVFWQPETVPDIEELASFRMSKTRLDHDWIIKKNVGTWHLVDVSMGFQRPNWIHWLILMAWKCWRPPKKIRPFHGESDENLVEFPTSPGDSSLVGDPCGEHMSFMSFSYEQGDEHPCAPAVLMWTIGY